MKLQTKYFGEIEYEESEILTFPVGLFGFRFPVSKRER